MIKTYFQRPDSIVTENRSRYWLSTMTAENHCLNDRAQLDKQVDDIQLFRQELCKNYGIDHAALQRDLTVAMIAFIGNRKDKVKASLKTAMKNASDGVWTFSFQRDNCTVIPFVTSDISPVGRALKLLSDYVTDDGMIDIQNIVERDSAILQAEIQRAKDEAVKIKAEQAAAEQAAAEQEAKDLLKRTGRKATKENIALAMELVAGNIK